MKHLGLHFSEEIHNVNEIAFRYFYPTGGKEKKLAWDTYRAIEEELYVMHAEDSGAFRELILQLWTCLDTGDPAKMRTLLVDWIKSSWEVKVRNTRL